MIGIPDRINRLICSAHFPCAEQIGFFDLVKEIIEISGYIWYNYKKG